MRKGNAAEGRRLYRGAPRAPGNAKARAMRLRYHRRFSGNHAMQPLNQQIRFCAQPRRRAPRLGDARQRAAADQGRQLAVPPRVRLGQPGLAPPAARAVARPHASCATTSAAAACRTGRSTTLASRPGCATSRPWSTPPASSAFALLGISQGASIAIAYAVRHPERVTHLVLHGGYARGRLVRSSTPEQREEAEMMMPSWPSSAGARTTRRSASSSPRSSSPAARPSSTTGSTSSSASRPRRERGALHARVQRASTSRRCCRRCAARRWCCTARHDVRVPFDEGRLIAGAIPGARFVPIDSRNHLLLEHEPGWQRWVDEVRAFLPAAARPADAGFAALTARERELLELIAQGRDNAQIAAHARRSARRPCATTSPASSRSSKSRTARRRSCSRAKRASATPATEVPRPRNIRIRGLGPTIRPDPAGARDPLWDTAPMSRRGDTTTIRSSSASAALWLLDRRRTHRGAIADEHEQPQCNPRRSRRSVRDVRSRSPHALRFERRDAAGGDAADRGGGGRRPRRGHRRGRRALRTRARHGRRSATRGDGEELIMRLSGLSAAIAAEHCLGIDDCAGCTLRVVEGQVWITVEGQLRDIIANPGDAVPLEQGARTYVSAFRDAVVLVAPLSEARDVTFEVRGAHGLRTLSIGVARGVLATAAATAARFWGAVARVVCRLRPAPRARDARGVPRSEDEPLRRRLKPVALRLCDRLDCLTMAAFPTIGRNHGFPEYRRLGRSGLEVSVLCLGTMMFGGRTGRARRARSSLTRATRRQLHRHRRRVRQGASERSPARAIRAHRDTGSWRRRSATRWTDEHQAQRRAVAALDARRATRASRASRTDYIDIYYLHRDDPARRSRKPSGDRRSDPRRQSPLFRRLEFPRLAHRGNGAACASARRAAPGRLPAVLQPAEPDAGSRDPAGLRPLRPRRRALFADRARRADRQVREDAVPADSRVARKDKRMMETEFREESIGIAQSSRRMQARPGARRAVRARVAVGQPDRLVGDRRSAHGGAVAGLRRRARNAMERRRRSARRLAGDAGPPLDARLHRPEVSVLRTSMSTPADGSQFSAGLGMNPQHAAHANSTYIEPDPED